MSIIGIFTDLALDKMRTAAGTGAFQVKPTYFGVSTVADALDPTRTTANANEFYKAAVSSRVNIDSNKVAAICTVPPGDITGITSTIYIKECYLYGETTIEGDTPFLMCIFHPAQDVQYDPTGSTTLRLQMSLVNTDLTSLFTWDYTQATEITEHNTDPNAHSQILVAMGKAGIFVNSAHHYRGQDYDDQAVFDIIGRKASYFYKSVTFTADNIGEEGNSITLIFDGIKTIAEVLEVWNLANPTNTVSSNSPDESIVFSAKTFTLYNGSKAVTQNDLVYKDLDGKYRPAMDDGTIRSNVSGIADLGYSSAIYSGVTFTANNEGEAGNNICLQFDGSRTIATVLSIWNLANPTNTVSADYTGSGYDSTSILPTMILWLSAGISNVISRGFYAYTTGEAIGTRMYLSKVSPGEMTSSITDVPIATVHGIDYIYLFPVVYTPTFINAYCSDLPGYNYYSDLQDAIDACSDGGRILVTKIHEVTDSLNTNDKRIDFIFTGAGSGIKKFPGQDEIQHIAFDNVPTAGTWRIYIGSEYTTNLAFDATITTIANAINALSFTDVEVTGNYSDGFTITFTGADGNTPQSLIDFSNVGSDEIQNITFNELPTSGTWTITFEGQTTSSLAYNATSTQVQTALATLSTIGSGNISVAGSPESGYTVEFTGALAKTDVSLLTTTSSLFGGSGAITISVIQTTPGLPPANSLTYGGGIEVTLTPTRIQAGIAVGNNIGLILGANNCKLVGMGIFEDFTTAIDLNEMTGTRIEMNFSNNTNNFDNSNLTWEDYNIEGSLGADNAQVEKGTADGQAYRWNNTTKRLEYVTNVIISSSGVITNANTTQSTDKDTGSVILGGGLGVEKNINTGGNMVAIGTITGSAVYNAVYN